MRADNNILPPDGASEVSLADHLSHLTLRRAETLLGADGRSLLAEGRRLRMAFQGTFAPDRRVFALTEEGGGGAVEFRLAGPGRKGLKVRCATCGAEPCLHQAGALAFVLEEKVALGLAKPAPEKVPMEWLSEPELVKLALAEREARAEAERMRVEPLDPSTPWTDYTVTSRKSGKSYRVALRGWARGDAYCTCPDFRKNTLGACKHTLHVVARAKRKFSAAVRRKPWKPDRYTLSLSYGKTLKLRFEGPERGSSDAVTRLVHEFVGKEWDRAEDAARVVSLVRTLARMGEDVVIYPDAEEYLSQTLDRRQWVLRMENLRGQAATHPLRHNLLQVPLLPYQLEGIAFAAGAGRAILADEMGLGKTIQAIGLAELLAREDEVKRVLVVCPASLKSQWAAEIGRFSHRDWKLVLGVGPSRAKQYRSGAFFTICNYEQVTKDQDAVTAAHWDLIVLDEGQRIKNWEAKTSRAIKSLRSRYALVLSGTPLENRLDELFSVMEFIDDRQLGPAFRFFNRHRVVDEKGKVIGYQHLGEIRKKLRPYLLRRTRASVLGDLPPRTTEIVRIPATEEQFAISAEQMRIVSAITRKKHLNEMDLFRLRRALLTARLAADSTFLIDHEPPGHSSKLERLGELLAVLAGEEDRKIVMFSEWTTMLNLIEPLLTDLELGYVRLQGSVPQKDRQALVDRFQKDPNCRVFLTTNAGSTGLNLQAANTVINVDLPWNPAILEQRIARAHRMGQPRPVQVYLLVTEGTIEENLLATLGAKHELAQAALDFDSELDSVDLASGLEDLKRRLEILLGKPPESEAAIDEAARDCVLAQTKSLAERRQRVEAAGGELLGAALAFLAEMLPESPVGAHAREAMAQQVRASLGECLETEADGRLRLSFTLADTAAVDRLAIVLSRWALPSPSESSPILAD